MTPINQYYGSLGNLGSPAGPMGLVQPGQSMTPPLSGNYCVIVLSHLNISVACVPLVAKGIAFKIRIAATIYHCMIVR
jgi:hypothetical protein